MSFIEGTERFAMDIRTMKYYLAVIREGNISAAAQSLHVAQPSLSRQMKELEEELHTTLFIRVNRKITLTEEGMILRKRAEEMVRLMQMTQEEISHVRNNITGTVRIGAGKSHIFHYLSRAAGAVVREQPDVRFQIVSGDTEDLMDQLNNGLIDFALIFTETDHSLYQTIELPQEDHFGVLMPMGCELSVKEQIRLTDLKNYPLIMSRQALPLFSGTDELSSLNIVATYNLVYNASLLVEDGLGLAVTFKSLINTTGNSRLCFRPLIPNIKNAGKLIWKKYQILSSAVQLFTDMIRKNMMD